jgi:hypothetical protein
MRINAEKEIMVHWKDNQTLTEVKIYLQDELLAMLRPGAKPGWCVNALKDGPLAKVLLA